MSLHSARSRLHIKHLIGFKCHQREREMKEDGGGEEGRERASYAKEDVRRRGERRRRVGVEAHGIR